MSLSIAFLAPVPSIHLGPRWFSKQTLEQSCTVYSDYIRAKFIPFFLGLILTRLAKTEVCDKFLILYRLEFRLPRFLGSCDTVFSHKPRLLKL